MRSSFWTFSGSGPAVAISLALFALLAWTTFMTWRRPGQRRLQAWLELFRLGIIGLILFTLFQPEFVRVTNLLRRSQIVVLHDSSGSMATRDVVVTQGVVRTRSEWVSAALANTPLWQPLAATGNLLFEEFGRPPTNAAVGVKGAPVGTDLNQALDGVLGRYQDLRTVLLLSDGDWNIGGSPLAAATKYRTREIPIYTAAAGSATYLPDLELSEVNAPAYGLLDEHIVIPFTIRSHIDHDVRTTIQLQGPHGMTASKSIVIPAQRQMQDSVVLSPTEEGDFDFELSFPAHPDEAIPDNNRAKFRMALKREVLKVLVIDSVPRWEYRYLRNALARDPGVAVDCLLLHPGMAPGFGPHYIREFPAGIETLGKYDVVFVGDVGVGPEEFTAVQAGLLKGLVDRQGSGLVFLPGPRGRQMSLLTGPLGDLMPVELDTTEPGGHSTELPSRLLLTELGKGHLLTMMSADEEENFDIWRSFPGFSWNAPVLKSRPGSETLAVHSTMRNQWGRVPLLVIREYGNGKVLFLGTDGAWRWRRGVEDKYHYRFWGQVVRWMSHKRHLAHNQGMRLFYAPETPRVGETVYVHATVFDRYGHPVPQKALTATVRGPDGKEEFVGLASSDAAWGTYQGQFIPAQAGAYDVRLKHPVERQDLEKRIVVSLPTVEVIGRPARADVLREIAEVTGGATGNAAELSRIVSDVTLLPRNKVLENRFRLWSNPWWGLLILTLLSVYWTGRKAAGSI